MPAVHLAALLIFGFSASRHARTHAYFVCAAVPIVASALRRFGSSLPARGLLAAAGAAGLIFFSSEIAPALLRFNGPFDYRHVPVRMAEFLKEERPELGRKRMLNVWHWGGYLGFVLHPDYKVFFDGRYIFHPLLESFHAAQASPRDFKGFLDANGIQVALLERTGLVLPVEEGNAGGGASPLWRPYYAFFMPERDWALIYWDRQGMVMARRAAFPMAWIEAREFKAFRPDDLDFAGRMLRRKALRREDLAAEVERYLRFVGNRPDAEEARAWLGSLR